MGQAWAGDQGRSRYATPGKEGRRTAATRRPDPGPEEGMEPGNPRAAFPRTHTAGSRCQTRQAGPRREAGRPRERGQKSREGGTRGEARLNPSKERRPPRLTLGRGEGASAEVNTEIKPKERKPRRGREAPRRGNQEAQCPPQGPEPRSPVRRAASSPSAAPGAAMAGRESGRYVRGLFAAHLPASTRGPAPSRAEPRRPPTPRVPAPPSPEKPTRSGAGRSPAGRRGRPGGELLRAARLGSARPDPPCAEPRRREGPRRPLQSAPGAGRSGTGPGPPGRAEEPPTAPAPCQAPAAPLRLAAPGGQRWGGGPDSGPLASLSSGFPGSPPPPFPARSSPQGPGLSPGPPRSPQSRAGQV
ncbi:basic salivary proline-rich protein 2-like [Calypte anna]|uniref:basic salivary proline-rich protein 2-like n=1 Tax=Calypte anna TaxID=9244 RepID=UPI0011C3F6B1|nr:basic salivary proline-rich protein 2-like [Calypte anna]